MEKRTAILLAEGFEETEAIVAIDVLRRVDIRIDTLASGPSREVVSYHQIPMKLDALLSERMDELYDAILLPGGPQGARNLGVDPLVSEFVRRHLDAGKLVCTICSAGAHVLAKNKLLGGRHYVCSGDNYKLYDDGIYVDRPIVREGNLITCKGMGLAFEFAFTVATLLIGPEKVEEQADHVYFDHWRKNFPIADF